MADINCHIVTFNCGRNLVNVDYLASSIYSSFQADALPPDLIVLALQELAPLGFSFLGGSFLDSYFGHLRHAVARATTSRFEVDVEWEDVVASHLGMTGIMLFARKDVMKEIHTIEEAGTGVGVKEMGNKGAVGVRVSMGEEDTTLTFVAAHLAPHEDAWARRNADWKSICENLVFEPSLPYDAGSTVKPSSEPEAAPLLRDSARLESRRGPHGMFSPKSYVFFAGDLNYRTSDTSPPDGASSSWPLPSADDNALLARDQLNRERAANRTLHHLSEASITFPPTYKYSGGAQKLAAGYAKAASFAASRDHASRTISDVQLVKAAEQSPEKISIWAKHRIPSWCDRILYLSSAPIEVHSYDALPVQPTSDHRPVALSCSVPRRPLQKDESVDTPVFNIQPGWRERRAVARRYELVVGVGAYLGFTSQGQVILLGTITAFVIGGIILSYAT